MTFPAPVWCWFHSGGLHGFHWICSVVRAVSPYGPADLQPAGRAAGLLGGNRVGSLPPVGAFTGTLGVRVVVDGRARRDDPVAVRDRGHPAGIPVSPGGAGAGRRDARGHVSGSL